MGSNQGTFCLLQLFTDFFDVQILLSNLTAQIVYQCCVVFYFSLCNFEFVTVEVSLTEEFIYFLALFFYFLFQLVNFLIFLCSDTKLFVYLLVFCYQLIGKICYSYVLLLRGIAELLYSLSCRVSLRFRLLKLLFLSFKLGHSVFELFLGMFKLRVKFS